MSAISFDIMSSVINSEVMSLASSRPCEGRQIHLLKCYTLFTGRTGRYRQPLDGRRGHGRSITAPYRHPSIPNLAIFVPKDNTPHIV